MIQSILVILWMLGNANSLAESHSSKKTLVGLSPHGRAVIESGSKEGAVLLGELYQKAKKRRLLDGELIRYFGYLFAGDSFDPKSDGFARYSRDVFEDMRMQGSEEEKANLDEGLRQRFLDHLERSQTLNPEEAIKKLVQALPIWADPNITKVGDVLATDQNLGTWDFAVKTLGLLFLLRARHVSPEAKAASNRVVELWLDNLVKEGLHRPPREPSQAKQNREFLKTALSELGASDVLKKMDEQAERDSNRHQNGTLANPAILYAHQFRNLVLKEILQGFKMTASQREKVEERLLANEEGLTDMLNRFRAGENTEDGLSGFNTFAVATTVLIARNPGEALRSMRAISAQPWLPYRIDSDVKASARAGAARTVPFRLAELVHAETLQEKEALKQKLETASDNYISHIPDLMFHLRGKGWHRGEDQLTPYYFHPSAPFEAAALQLMSQDPSFEKSKKKIADQKALLKKALLASQKPDGTFALPDVKHTAGEGGYSVSPAWVNPLAGLTLLKLIEDFK
jgi:hypothetical protein